MNDKTKAATHVCPIGGYCEYCEGASQAEVPTPTLEEQVHAVMTARVEDVGMNFYAPAPKVGAAEAPKPDLAQSSLPPESQDGSGTSVNATAPVLMWTNDGKRPITDDRVISASHVLVPKNMRCHKCGASEPWKTRKPERLAAAPSDEQTDLLLGEAFSILKALDISVEWELAGTIKRCIKDFCAQYERHMAKVGEE